MKMYVLIKDSVPDKMAPVIAAHASLACYKKFEDDENMIQWMSGVFKKVVCKVSDAAFEKARTESGCLVMTESALNNEEVCVAFCPREEYPKYFRFLKL
ncbi:MAG: peptidyl-tRNA hydrolase [Cyclobacteriaceae bacterium]|nr:peptidyl-tRNA hydrolase [Cyclobacteriaceae bacterium]